MKNGVGLAALVVVLFMTGGSLWRFGSDRSSQVGGSTSAPTLLQSNGQPGENGQGQSEGGDRSAWPTGLSVIPDDGSQACVTDPVGASFLLNDAMRTDARFDPSTIAFVLDGADITGQSQIAGADDSPQSSATVWYQPADPLDAGAHQASITILDDDGQAETYGWSFTADSCEGGNGESTPPSGVSGPPLSDQPPAQPQGTPLTGAPPALPSGPAPAIPGSPQPQSQGALPPLGRLPSESVLHVIADHSWISPQGDVQRTSQTETWIDRGNGNARTTEKDPSTGNEISSTIRTGQSITQMFSQEKRAMTQILPDTSAPQLNEIRDALLGYRLAYEQNRLVYVGDDTIDGQPAVHVQVPPQGDSGGIDVWLRKDNGLLVREIAYAPGSSGSRQVAQTHVVTYDQVEGLSQVGADVFAPTIPSDWSKVVSKILSPDAASAMHDFDLYWLGSDYPGYSLVSISQDQVSGPPAPGAPAPPGGSMSFVAEVYVPSQPSGQGAPASVTILQRPASAQGAQSGRSAAPPPGGGPSGGPAAGALPGGPQGEAVTINGNHGTVIVPPPPPTPQPSQGSQSAGPAPALPTILDITIGGTEVTIQGKDRAQVMQVGQDLKRLNP